MTAFNPGRYLAAAISSLILQTEEDWELILVDNGSTDSSIKSADFQDERIQLFSLPNNIGRTKALNSGLDKCRGTFVAILDSDDVSFSRRFEIQAGFLESHLSHVLIGGLFNLINQDGQIVGSGGKELNHLEFQREVLSANPIAHSTVMFRREAAVDLGGYDSTYEYAQDFELTLRLLNVGKIEVLNEYLGLIRVHGASATKSALMKYPRAWDEYRCFRKNLKEVPLELRNHRVSRQRRALTAIWLGLVEIQQGTIGSGLKHLFEGVIADKTFSWIWVIKNRSRVS
jgi:glycosyltransferase involved in cell wall biosynthesis